MKKPKKTTKLTNTKLNTENSKILHETMVTLGALKEGSDALQEIPINEIQVLLLDDSGDGVILCLEYDEQTGELKKTFSSIDEHYDEVEAEVLEELGLEAPHYYNENGVEELDSCASPENVKELLNTMIEETISEEYDEIFHNSDDDEEPPPLLN